MLNRKKKLKKINIIKMIIKSNNKKIKIKIKNRKKKRKMYDLMKVTLNNNKTKMFHSKIKKINY